MEKLFQQLIKYPRFYKNGKDRFISYILYWSKYNANNFKVYLDNTKLSINMRELLKIIFILINVSILISILDNLFLYSYFGVIILFLLVFPIQFRVIFLLLSIITPSRNIILEKRSNINNYKEIIITAHYDTKNGILKKKNGFYKKYIKQNLYSLSRIISKYVLASQKLLIPLIVIGYVYYIFLYSKSLIDVFNPIDYYQKTQFIMLGFINVIIVNSFLCALLMWLINLSIIKELRNDGADDNTSGVVGALEIARRLNTLDLNYNLKIVLFDNEEKGLIGSNHYVNKNYKTLKNRKTQIVNLDCIGRGNRIYILTEKYNNNYLYKKIKSYMNKKRISYNHSNMDYSDHKPFLNEGINAISIGRYNSEKYLWIKDFPQIDWIHGSEDCIENIDISKIEEVISIVINTINDV